MTYLLTEQVKSESHLGLESAAELPGSTYPRPAGDSLEDTGSCIPAPTQLSLCLHREGCPWAKVLCSPVSHGHSAKRKVQRQSLIDLKVI